MEPKRRNDLLRELASEVCFCGSDKTARQMFCKKHYYLLPGPMRKALYNDVGKGYQEAYDDARAYFRSLDVNPYLDRKRAPR